MNETAVGVILLAAGASSRMGEPKQLLRYRGETLMGRALRAALETRCRPVVVVLGAGAEELRAEVVGKDALVVFNEAWAEGMGSSIRAGLSALQTATSTSGAIDAAVVLLCDQPFVTSDIITRLVEAHLTRRALLVASAYESRGERTLSAPALFSRALFPELMALNGAEGAKRIIQRHAADVVCVETQSAAFDVDTPDDYHALQAETPPPKSCED